MPYHPEDADYPTIASAPRKQWLTDLVVACTLHFAVFCGGSWVTGIVEKAGGYQQAFSPAPTGLAMAVVFLALLVAVSVWKRPSYVEWSVPFSIFVAYWFLFAVISNISHHDMPNDGEMSIFAPAMFAACISIVLAPPLLRRLLASRK